MKTQNNKAEIHFFYRFGDKKSFDVFDKREKIAAVTHVDGARRLQTVDKDGLPQYRRLIEEFYKRTGVPVILNTSFNVRGEPIVTTPADAIRCFYSTGIDYLTIGDYLVKK